MIYYVYSKKTGRLINKTNKVEELNKYLPHLVDVVVY